MWLPDILGDPGVDSFLWTLGGLGAVIAVVLLGGWLHSSWTSNLLRNHIEAQRRLRREGRDVGRDRDSRRSENSAGQ